MDKRIIFAVVIVAAIAVAGCTGQPPVTGTSGNTVKITEFALQPDTVRSNSTVSVSMNIENQGDSVVKQDSGVIWLIVPTDWGPADLERNKSFTRDLRPSDPATNRPADTQSFRWSLKAPQIPKGQVRPDNIAGRIYYDYVSDVNGVIYAYPLGEKTSEKSKFTYGRGPVKITIKSIPDPYVVELARDTFTLQIDLEDVGNGLGVYKAGSITSSDLSLAEGERNKILLNVSIPSAVSSLSIQSDCRSQEVELVKKRATVVCDIVADKMPVSKELTPITITAKYGYFDEIVKSVTVTGR
ncbi:MAG: hypothetical protein HY362_02215 [Candidatus Aenigmarchaeota archaeon]|nr:hypothetical protein [Candidatus Aenigmarchaeota archaeon]